MGEAFAGRTVGKKAMLWGILAQSVPDIDFISSLWLNTVDHLIAHRGFTHSLLFTTSLAPVLAYIAMRLHHPHNISYGRWVAFFIAAMLGHVFIDTFNNYGVGWFEPFSSYRISFDTIYVADPFFSIMPGIATIVLLIKKQKSSYRSRWWKIGLVSGIIYLGYTILNKTLINKRADKLLANHEIVARRVLTTPAPLQNWLWYMAAETDSGYYTGYISVFDSKTDNVLTYSPRRDELQSVIANKEETDKLIRFSKGFYTLEMRLDTILFNDLRFGKITGWSNPQQRFAFHYYLQPKLDNTLVVQRGRFANWNKKTFNSFIKRIKGN